ncbi:hypothetical protein CsSME_00021670 [Camellia sinensis var. sinensis]
MPSSHSATVTALAAAVGFYDGFGGSLFATALILACVVMYDAFGVRLHAGRQAEVCCSPSLPPTPTTETHSHVLILWIVICLSLLVLNQIVYELPAEHPLAESRPLRELLGHTPQQVIAGALLGLVTAIIGYVITGSSKQA